MIRRYCSNDNKKKKEISKIKIYYFKLLFIFRSPIKLFPLCAAFYSPIFNTILRIKFHGYRIFDICNK